MPYLGTVELKSSDIRRIDITSSTSATHTLTWTAPNEQSLIVTINGVKQQNNYTVSGTTLTLDTALESTDLLEVIGINDIGTTITPAQGSVDTDQLANVAVTTAKLADDNVTTAKILDNNVTLAKLDDGTQGDILYYGASGAPARLGFGTSGDFLKTQGTGANPVWATVSDNTTQWQSVQATGFTAVAGNGYPCNTTSGIFTVTLPASASVGDTIEFVDYAGTFDTNNVTLNPNGLNLKGATDNLRIITEREGVTITYVDATQGWVVTSGSNEGTPALSPEEYSIDFLVVAGGGGSGSDNSGGGGGGGYRTSTQVALVGTAITITVGDGGAGAANTGVTGSNGSDSSIAGTGLTTITSAGGGGGGSHTSTGVIYNGTSGGSGGGGGSKSSPAGEGAGGSGNTPATSPVQGYDGGTGDTDAASWAVGGGGGGASEVGENYVAGTNAGDGGDGSSSSITGASVTRAGGGGGGSNSGSFPAGAGGAGGGGAGSGTGSGTAGTVNTGGGGGGSLAAGVAGGKGIVILSVPTAEYSSTTTGSPTVSTSGLNTIMEFTGTGSYTA